MNIHYIVYVLDKNNRSQIPIEDKLNFKEVLWWKYAKAVLLKACFKFRFLTALNLKTYTFYMSVPLAFLVFLLRSVIFMPVMRYLFCITFLLKLDAKANFLRDKRDWIRLSCSCHFWQEHERNTHNSKWTCTRILQKIKGKHFCKRSEYVFE